MFVTEPKVVKYIEEFEALKTVEAPLSEIELSAQEQVILYTITEMFSRDKIFRLYVSMLTYDFAKKTITLSHEELSKTLAKVVISTLQLNNKGE